jgi:hypothetical protein
MYYEMLLVHTNDLLCISEDPKSILTKLDQHYLLKKDSIGVLKTYLGTEIGDYRLPDDPGKTRWSMSSSKYVKDAMRNVKNWLDAKGSYLKTKCSSVLPSGYGPELDVSNYCNDEEANYFQQHIGVLRWTIELGRIDITAEVSMLAAFTAAPHQGHLQALFHIFAYLSKHDQSKLVFNDGYIKITDEVEADWTSFYPDANEHIPTNMTEALLEISRLIVTTLILYVLN